MVKLENAQQKDGFVAADLIYKILSRRNGWLSTKEARIVRAVEKSLFSRIRGGDQIYRELRAVERIETRLRRPLSHEEILLLGHYNAANARHG